MKKIVVLGAGLVARAHVRYLLDHGYRVTVADMVVGKAEEIVAGHENGSAVAFDIEADADRLQSLVGDHDLVVSLLPWIFHPRVARACLATGAHLVTASYVKDEMKALDEEARSRGVILLNELGADPGIDHMTAMRIIHQVQAEGGEITTFQSYCGGLPAPEANDNPFGYKVSWSARSVLLAGLSPARFKREGRVVEVTGEDLFDNVWQITVDDVDGRPMSFEGYPNRDSMPYTEVYGIEPRDMMFRGTLRNPGWCSSMKQLTNLGMLRMDEIDGLEGKSYAELTARLIDTSTSARGDDLRSLVARHLGLDPGCDELDRMEWLGLFSDRPLPGPAAPMDILAANMLETMMYKQGERDMVVLQHTFVAEYPDRKERLTSTMVDLGIPGGDSSMNRAVGLPAAVGARLILEGGFEQPGVVVPVMPQLYEPALRELERLGITFTETCEVID